MLSKYQKERFSVLPGMTGLAQIYGRSKSNIYEAFKKDVYWIKTYSIKNYFCILLKTATKLFKNQAY
jgi:lipopolysaccharide/colanic/teichoic acid biosynthesis glycosyltransferase